MIRKIIFLFFLQAISFHGFSQEGLDSSYVKTLPDQLHFRSFLAKKYMNLTVSSNGKKPLNYEPNSDISFGIGATVRSFSFNLAYGFKFLNTEIEKGETRVLDLQAHVYKRKYIADGFVQLYNGFFLGNTKSLDGSFPEPYYLRPDFNVSLLGVSVLKVYNWRKFSYAAPFVQNEIQEKSAGTFLFGGRMFASRISSDSALTPNFVNDSLYGSLGFLNRDKEFHFGPSVGYAYSLVVKKRIFLIVSVNLAFMIGPVEYSPVDMGEQEAWQVNPVLGTRLGLGYNSPKWYLGLTLLQEGTTIKGVDDLGEANISGGNLQFTYVKRFEMGQKLKSMLKKLPL